MGKTAGVKKELHEYTKEEWRNRITIVTSALARAHDMLDLFRKVTADTGAPDELTEKIDMNIKSLFVVLLLLILEGEHNDLDLLDGVGDKKVKHLIDAMPDRLKAAILNSALVPKEEYDSVIRTCMDDADAEDSADKVDPDDMLDRNIF